MSDQKSTRSDSNSKPLISVVIPTRNPRLDFLNQALLSVRRQSINLSLIEVLLVSHLETDERRQETSRLSNNTLGPIPHRLIKLDDRETTTNSARKVGFNHSDGSYIFFLDADDMISVDCFEVLTRLALNQQGSSPDIVLGAKSRMSEDGFRLSQRNHRKIKLNNENLRFHPELLNSFSVCNVLFRRNTLDESFSNGEFFHEDISQFARALRHVKRVSATPCTTYFYRDNESSITNKSKMKRLHFKGIGEGIKELSKTSEVIGGSWLAKGEIASRDLIATLLSRSKNLSIGEVREGLSETRKFLERRHPLNLLIKELENEETWEGLESKASARGLNISPRSPLEYTIPKTELFSKLRGKSICICLTDYHVELASDYFADSDIQIVDLSAAILNGSRAYKGTQERIVVQGQDLPMLWTDLAICPLVFTFNDIDFRLRDALEYRALIGLPTIGIIERVSDVNRTLDANLVRGMNLSANSLPYRKCDLVLTPFSYQVRLLEDRKSKTVGDPLITKLIEEKKLYDQDSTKVLINLNFTYGVQMSKSRDFLVSAVNAVVRSGLEPSITRHPADETPVRGYEHLIESRGYLDSLRESSMLITKFSGLVPIAVAMEKKVLLVSLHKESLEMLPQCGFIEEVQHPDQIYGSLLQHHGSRRGGCVKHPGCLHPNPIVTRVMGESDLNEAIGELETQAHNLIGEVRSLLDHAISKETPKREGQSLNFTIMDRLYKWLTRHPRLLDFVVRLKPAFILLRQILRQKR